MISIVSLIYKNPKWADFVYDSVHRYTKELHTGEAEFFIRLGNMGIDHITSFDSVVFHFKEGEMKNK